MTQWKEAFCVLCGRTMGKRNITPEDKPWLKYGEVNRWEETQEFTGDKPFGVVKVSEGKASLRMERYYDIDEDTDGYFPFMKARILTILGEWLAKGWLTREEILEAILE